MLTYSRRSLYGKTLIEILITLMIVSTLLSIMYPTINQWLDKFKIRSLVNNDLLNLMNARRTAIMTGQYISVCPLNQNLDCTDDWNASLTAFIDINDDRLFDSQIDQKLFSFGMHNTNFERSFNRGKMTFSPTGEAFGFNGTLQYCHTSNNEVFNLTTHIILSGSGRLRIEHPPLSVCDL